MKLTFPSIKVESSNDFKTKDFGFGDPALIMTILRSKMYSRPVFIICQEIMSNSRDANREVGRAHIPTKVILPSKLDPMIHFQDNGPGITPDRMENIFLKYGASTKRSDNTQTGGFGLGAKTPFAYSDSFTITTISNEADGRRMKRQYISFIDSNRLGSMSEISREETTEETGTTISIGVQNKDIDEFVASAVEVGQFWNPQPILENHPRGAFKFPEVRYITKGSNWAIVSNDNQPRAIIDGISYKLDRQAIEGKNSGGNSYNSYGNHYQQSLLDVGIHLNFKVGELQVTANRESLDYQDEVVKAIKDRLEDAKKELQVCLDNEMKACKNLWDACIKWKELKTLRSYARLVDAKWSGMDIFDHIEIPSWCPNGQLDVKELIKISVFSDDGNGNVEQARPGRYQRYYRQIEPNPKTLLILNDTDSSRPNKMRIKTLLSMYPNISLYAVISAGFSDDTKNKQAMDWLETKYNFSKLEPIKLSTIPKAKVAKGTRGPNVIIPVKVLTEEKTRRGKTWSFEPSTTLLDDPAGGVYVIIKDGAPQFGDTPHDVQSLAFAASELSITLNGILTKFQKKIGPQWRKFDDVVIEKLNALKNTQEIKDFVTSGGDNSASERFTYGDDFETLEKEVSEGRIASTSPFAKWIRSSASSGDAEDQIKHINGICNRLGLTSEKVEFTSVKQSSVNMIDERYPLLVSQKYFDNHNKQKTMKAITNYIAMVDKELSNATPTNP